ncbi:SMI1/KNR4 family protein [Streptomyces sp. NPDC005263]|uniref:SMI1/KNR4 family protein n=1 Tax=Streptomyces sp. NPDC005263 TaxID=3364711 RepID=UPI0036B70603
MSVPSVEASWARIDTWLRRHAPVSHALLRPPASPSDIEAAERTLGVRFHPDLVDSLRCHDGVELERGAPVLAHFGPLSRVSDIVGSTTFLRDIRADMSADETSDQDDEDDYDDEDDHELDAWWHKDWLLITLGIGRQSSDGLFLTCHAGANWGRPGRYFDEDSPSFTPWPSLRHVLADYADALENGSPFNGLLPLPHEGILLWEEERTTLPDPVSPLALAAAAGEPEPQPEPEPAPNPEGALKGARLIMIRRRNFPPPPPPPIQPDVVFAEHLTPAELLRRLGAIPDTVRPRSRGRAQESAASPWAAYRPMARAGSVGGWAYATQEGGAAQFTRPEVLRRASAGTRAVALTRRGPEVQVTVTEDGVPLPEAGRHVLSPREAGAYRWPGSTATYARFLTELEAEFGITYRPADDTETELTSALLLPPLEHIDGTAEQVVDQVRQFDLAALVERTPPARLRAATAAQLARLAAETRLDVYDEVRDALARIDRDEPVDIAPDGPLDLRIRTLEAEVWAARESLRGQHGTRNDHGPVTEADLSVWTMRAQAARALREFVETPVPAAASTILHHRMSLHWRTELAADLERER